MDTSNDELGQTHPDADARHGNHAAESGIGTMDATAPATSDISAPLSPTPRSAFSPRMMAVQQLKRAASVREGTTTTPASPGSPSTRGIVKLGLERSASDAARRVAMAKLTGEKIVAPPEYTSPRTPLPTGPPPSLAELQARAEQRLAGGSPLPASRDAYVGASSGSSSNGHSRGDSSADGHELYGSSVAPSRSASALSRNASTRRGETLSRNASIRQGEILSRSASLRQGSEPDNDEERQKERQEARTNLIRKLSRGRLGPGAAAAARERSETESPRSGDAGSASSTLQRRPSLAEVLARAESRQQSRMDIPNMPVPSADAQYIGHETASDPAPFVHDDASSWGETPGLGSARYVHSPASSVRDRSPLDTSAPSERVFGLLSHGSVDSTASEHPSYRHTVRTEGESATAGFESEDNFEFEGLAHTIQRPWQAAARQEANALDVGSQATAQEPPRANLEAAFFSPPNSPPDARLLSGNERLDSFVLNTEPGTRALDSMPETPDILSPITALSLTSPATALEHGRIRTAGIAHEGGLRMEEQSDLSAESKVHATPFSFLQHRPNHGGNLSSDSFLVSVSTSHSSRHISSNQHVGLFGRSNAGMGHEHNVQPAFSGSKQREDFSPRQNEAGPSSEYRFPGPTSPLALRRPQFDERPSSVHSGHVSDRMDSLIRHLEGMQAADNSTGSTGPVPESSSMLWRSDATLAPNAESAASGLHRLHDVREPVFPVAPEIPASTAQTPISAVTVADYAKYTNSKLAPFPGLADLERQRALKPEPDASQREIASQPPTIGTLESQLQRAASSGSERVAGRSSLLTEAPMPAHSSSQLPRMTPEVDSGSRPPAAPPREQVMQRLSELLSSYAHPTKPTKLDSPPRRLLLHSPVLQVVNANTVKDRYLFLFTDILIIAKPVIEEDDDGELISPSLDGRFLVKSIVELPKLKLTTQATDGHGEDTVQKRKHPLLLTFVDRFASDPRKAVTALINKAGLSNDPSTIANLLFRNPELNRSQLGAYLAGREQKHVLRAYCERFRVAGVRVEDALRAFLASLRLPNDYAAAEYLLSVFAAQWLAANPGTGMSQDTVFATKLVISIMELNDALHSGLDDETAAAGNLFSFPNSAITVDDFIAAFRLKDPHGALPDEQLTRIYLAIRKDRLVQASDNSSANMAPEIEATIHPSRLPNRLTYRMPSEEISIRLPQTDPKFSIKLSGQDLRFDPPILTFSKSREATFRVTPTALGAKAMILIRVGQNANLYRNLPINKTFSVERAFMNHTFQVAFLNHLGVKRKYLFSLTGADARQRWIDTLKERIESSPIEQNTTPRAAKAVTAVSLQVLRDALIVPDDPVPGLVNAKAALSLGRPGLSTPPGSRGGQRGTHVQRSNSTSKTYVHGAGRAELDLEERRPSANLAAGSLTALSSVGGRRGSRDEERLRHAKVGHELVSLTQQNSLMPLVLGFVTAGAGIDAMPRKGLEPLAIKKSPQDLERRAFERLRA